MRGGGLESNQETVIKIKEECVEMDWAKLWGIWGSELAKMKRKLQQRSLSNIMELYSRLLLS